MKLYKLCVGAMGTNCYIVTDGDGAEAAVVDPGAECDRILETVRSKGLTVTKIILTHAHFDHILALTELRKATGAPLYIHKDEAETLGDGKKNLLARFSDTNETPAPAEVLLTDGDTVKIGNTELTVMHTPGHTPGSMCLICGDTIICGDTLFREGIGRYDFPGGDYKTLIESCMKLTALEGDYKLYPGHGPSSTLDYERANNFYLI